MRKYLILSVYLCDLQNEKQENNVFSNNSNIGKVNAFQKKFAYLPEMGEPIKNSLLIKTLLQ